MRTRDRTSTPRVRAAGASLVDWREPERNACTELVPDRGFQYRVIAEGGSGVIRGGVLKKALDSERETWATVAHVRMVGQSSFRMSYRYLNVNGRDLEEARDPCTTGADDTQSSLTPFVASGARSGSHVD